MAKRNILFVCVLLAAFFAFGSAVAANEAPIVATIELVPSSLTSPGTVDVSITVSNASDTDMKDPVILYDPAAQVVSDFGASGQAMLKAGESLTWKGTYDVNQRTLDNGSVVYFVKYTNYRDSGEPVEQSMPIRAKLSQQVAATAMQVKRDITPTVAEEGQKITVEYHITNAGTVSLMDIVITENGDIHGEAQKIPELKAEQTADISYSVTMGKSNLTSGALITYTSGSDGAQTYVVPDQVITNGSSDLTATLTASAKGVVKNGVVTLKLNLNNKGSVDFSNIRVSDATLGEVFSNQELAAGKSLELQKEITLTATTDYQFTVTATDSAGVETATATEVVTVSAINPEDALNLTLVASSDKAEAYGDPAKVRFSLQITNDSGVDGSDVAISHGDVTLDTFVSIAAGETRTLSRDAALSNSGKYQFTATAVDPLGNTMTFKSNELQIAVYAPTPVPTTPTPPPNPTPEPTFQPVTVIPIRDPSIGAVPKAVQSVLLPVLIVAGALLVAACVLLIVATKRRSDQKKASEAAYDHLERAKRRDYVTPSEEDEGAGAAEAEKTDEARKPLKELTQEEQDAQMANRRIVGEDEIKEWELPHVKYARDAAQADGDEEENEVYSAMRHGLYDEELANAQNGEDASDFVDDEAALYGQPGEETPGEDEALHTQETLPVAPEDGEEGDGYTDELAQDYGAPLPGEETYAADGLGYDADGLGFGASLYEDPLAGENAVDGSVGDLYGEPADQEETAWPEPIPEQREPSGQDAGREPAKGSRTGRSRSRQARNAGNDAE